MHCKRLGVPVLWFVSPQLWAWKRRRLRWVQRFVDRMLVIFPFEAPSLPSPQRQRRVRRTSPREPPLPAESREEYARANGLNDSKAWIALLPGSRWNEVVHNLPIMLDAATEMGLDYEFVIPVASTLKKESMLELIASEEQYRDRYRNSDKNFSGILRLVPDARAALHYASASVVASGTATVQALTIGNPFVVVYRVSALTFAIAKRLIRYPAEIPAQPDAYGNLPIAMPNLIAGRRIVPELINQQFTAANLVTALRPLLDDTPAAPR